MNERQSDVLVVTLVHPYWYCVGVGTGRAGWGHRQYGMMYAVRGLLGRRTTCTSQHALQVSCMQCCHYVQSEPWCQRHSGR
jgi:hypothetical protein